MTVLNYPIKTLALFITGVFFLASCDTGLDDNGTGDLQVIMYDAPGDYEEVNVSIDRVEIHRETGDQDTGWETISEESQSHNLLELVNGAQAELGIAELEEGNYRQIRLILGDDNSVVINGETHELTVPSGQQTGIKLNTDISIEPGVTFTLELDFDAAESVVEADGQSEGPEYLLQPVIRTSSELTSGAISGSIEQADELTKVSVEAGDETINTHSEEGSGEFLLRGVPDGTYTVSFDPVDTDSNYESTEVEGVEVNIGENTEMDQVSLPEEEQEEG